MCDIHTDVIDARVTLGITARDKIEVISDGKYVVIYKRLTSTVISVQGSIYLSALFVK